MDMSGHHSALDTRPRRERRRYSRAREVGGLLFSFGRASEEIDVCRCRKSNPGRPFSNHSLHYTTLHYTTLHYTTLHSVLEVGFVCRSYWTPGRRFAVETFCSWLDLTSSRLRIEKWAWKIKYVYLFLRSGKLLAAFLTDKHRLEVEKGFEEVIAKLAGHHYTYKL